MSEKSVLYSDYHVHWESLCNNAQCSHARLACFFCIPIELALVHNSMCESDCNILIIL